MPVPEAVGSKRVVQIIRLHPPAMISTWLWCYAAEFKVAGSIPGLSGCILIEVNILAYLLHTDEY